jgi:hypothetical protein
VVVPKPSDTLARFRAEDKAKTPRLASVLQTDVFAQLPLRSIRCVFSNRERSVPSIRNLLLINRHRKHLERQAAKSQKMKRSSVEVLILVEATGGWPFST